MSDHWLQYVPKDPVFQPGAAPAAQARRLLASFLPDAESVDSRFHEKVVFFDPGANWSGVHCPSCGADAQPWWGDAMSQAFEADFTDLQCTAACCGAAVSLNGLRYLWPAAFGSYVLEAMNPNARGLKPEQIEQLQAVLGCELVEIPRHL